MVVAACVCRLRSAIRLPVTPASASRVWPISRSRVATILRSVARRCLINGSLRDHALVKVGPQQLHIPLGSIKITTIQADNYAVVESGDAITKLGLQVPG